MIWLNGALNCPEFESTADAYITMREPMGSYQPAYWTSPPAGILVPRGSREWSVLFARNAVSSDLVEMPR